MSASAIGGGAPPGLVCLESLAHLQTLKRCAMLLVLFGSPDCGVCEAVKPGLAELARRYPPMTLAYADCTLLREVCAQCRVFTLPAVKFYVDGRLSLEMARSFSLFELDAHVERICRLREQGGPGATPFTGA